MTKIGYCAVLLLVGICWYSAELQGKEAVLGEKAPLFFLSTYNSKLSGTERIFLDRLIGPEASDPKKVVLISFFNIDCKPCKQELPFLQKLYSRYRDKGLEVLVVNCDYQSDKIAELIKFIDEFQFKFPVLKDRFQALQRRYGVESFPTMFVLNREGTILDIRVGYNQEKQPFPLTQIQRWLGVPEEPLQ